MDSDQEVVLYRGTPSQMVNYNVYTVCVLMFVGTMFLPWVWNEFFHQQYADYKKYFMLVSKNLFFVPIIWAIITYLQVSHHKYTITNQRFTEQVGILSKSTDVLELFRVKDISLSEPFSLRMFGCGNIIMDTSDKSTPIVVIHAIKNTRQILELLQKNVEIMRIKKGVREID